jgi:hypothetical protein
MVGKRTKKRTKKKREREFGVKDERETRNRKDHSRLFSSKKNNFFDYFCFLKKNCAAFSALSVCGQSDEVLSLGLEFNQ